MRLKINIKKSENFHTSMNLYLKRNLGQNISIYKHKLNKNASSIVYTKRNKQLCSLV